MRNAIEAMHDCGRRELLVTTKAVDGDMIEVSVADTGPGISEEIADRLFQPFVTTKPSGMGVGLSISKRIIEAHGGEMWAETESRRGHRISLHRAAGRRDGAVRCRITLSSILSMTTRPFANRSRSC